jgi:hypothetical protein
LVAPPSLSDRFADEIKKLLANISIFESAARKAAKDVRAGRGRPRGDSVLPPEYINELARVFRKSTGLKYDASEGLFAQFVRSFLVATGRASERSSEYAVDSIKYARRLKRKNASGSALSFI